MGEGREEAEEEQVGAGPAAARAHLLTWRRAGAGGLVDTVLGTPGVALQESPWIDWEDDHHGTRSWPV